MSITNDLNEWWSDYSNFDESNKAKAALQEIAATIDRAVADLLELKQAGDFDSLPVSAYDAAVLLWQKLNTVNNSIKNDQSIQDLLKWNPSV